MKKIKSLDELKVGDYIKVKYYMDYDNGTLMKYGKSYAYVEEIHQVVGETLENGVKTLTTKNIKNLHGNSTEDGKVRTWLSNNFFKIGCKWDRIWKFKDSDEAMVDIL